MAGKLRSASAVLVWCLAWGGAAEAASPTVALNIPRLSLSQALNSLAIQANVSISTGRAMGCLDPRSGLKGRYRLDQGLSRILRGTGCSYRILDAGAVEVFRNPVAEPVSASSTPASSAVTALDELVIVATRRPTAAARLPYPVSAVPAEVLEGQGIGGARDLALITPAMTTTNLGAGRNKILLRGLSDGPLTGRTQSMVGIYLDNSRITYSAPDPDLRLADMSQIEVLRGPQGALYGAGSLGGVVRLRTVQPDRTAASAWVSGTAEITKGGAPSSVLEAMVNLPLMDGRAAVRGVGYVEAQGGYIDNPRLGLKDVNRSVRQGARLSGLLEITPDWKLGAGLTAQFISSDDTQYVSGGAGPYGRFNPVREPHDNDFLEGHLDVSGQFGWGQANLSTALIRHQVGSRYDATGFSPVAAPAGPLAYDDEDNITTFVSEASLVSAGDPRNGWLVGGFYATTRQTLGLKLTGLAGTPSVVFDEARTDRLEELALFGQASLALTDRLGVTLGGRVFHTDSRLDSRVMTPGTRAAFEARLSHTGFAPKIEATYRFGEAQLIYAQAAEGYRSGGANTTAAPGQAFSLSGATEPGRYYQGDELWNFEIGGRFSLMADRLSVRAALFDAVWSNIQSDQLQASGLPYTANIGDGRNLGLEMEANYREGDLTLHGSALFNGPELSRANPAFPLRGDLALAGVPEVSAELDATYVWDLPRDRRLELEARLAFVGKSSLTFDAATAPPMGGYGVGRLATTLSSPDWQLTLAADNLFDTHSDTFAYGNPFTLRTDRQSTPLRPRTVSVSVKRRW